MIDRPEHVAKSKLSCQFPDKGVSFARYMRLFRGAIRTMLYKASRWLDFSVHLQDNGREWIRLGRYPSLRQGNQGNSGRGRNLVPQGVVELALCWSTGLVATSVNAPKICRALKAQILEPDPRAGIANETATDWLFPLKSHHMHSSIRVE